MKKLAKFAGTTGRGNRKSVLGKKVASLRPDETNVVTPQFQTAWCI